MSQPLHIAVLSDGKPGHFNQSLGLAEAIGRIRPVEIETLKLGEAIFRAPRPAGKPDLVVGAGHRTHIPLVLFSKREKCPSIVLMKPSLPLFLFDLCVIPKHDLGSKNAGDHVIVSEGALNRVPPPGNRARNSGLILLGGPSSNHGWNEAEISEAIDTILQTSGDRPWRVTDSRRSPAGTLDRLKQAHPALAIYLHSETGPEWLSQRLSEAAETWVTEDSVSMIYEALSSGTRVGILPCPRKSESHRVIRGIDRLAEERKVTRFNDWTPGTPLPEPSTVLRESDRVAAIVLERLPISTDRPT